MFFSGKFVLDLAEFAERQGLRKSLVIQSVKIPFDDLSQDNFLVNYDTIEAVLKTIKVHLDDPCFGLKMGGHITLSATAYVDRLMDHCMTVEEAFQEAVNFSRLISDSMDCSLEISQGHFQVRYELNPDWALHDDYAIQQNLDMALICAQKALYRLTQKKFFPKEVNFYYPKPKQLSEYYRWFNCHLRFNRPFSSIVFHRSALQHPIQHSDHGLQEQLIAEAKDILLALPKESDLLRQVKKAILRQFTSASFSIDQIADELNLTTRTLQRKLKVEGYTFKQIQNDIRLQLVKKLIQNGITSLDELAYLVGFSEASALARAFKRWTGETVGRYVNRKTAKPQNSP